MSRRFASHNLKKHGDSQEVVQWTFLGIAMMLWIGAKINHNPMMPEIGYGAWATQFPAEWWAGSIMLASAIYLLGIIINGKLAWSPILRAAGAAWHVVTLGAFALSVTRAENADFMVISSGAFCVLHTVFLWWNIRDIMDWVCHGERG